MNILDAVILGIIQGLTEFLPISSSGHLVIGEALLGLSAPGMSLEIWLHFGTWLAVLVYFRRRIIGICVAIIGRGDPETQKRDRIWAVAIVIGTAPAVVVGLLLKSEIEAVFDSASSVAVMLMVTGLILLATRWAVSTGKKITPFRALAVGVAQSVAILPGISRSGSTIACALFLGLDPSTAAEFSFLLSVPIIAAAFGYDLIASGAKLALAQEITLYVLGAAVAFVFGLAAIHYLLKAVRTGKFFLFGFYCLVAGLISLILLH